MAALQVDDEEREYVPALTSLGNYGGQQVEVAHDAPCRVEGHALEAMHHYGPDGHDYGPTGFLWCPQCAGVADDPAVECTTCPDCGSRRLALLTKEEPFRFRCRKCGREFEVGEEEAEEE